MAEAPALSMQDENLRGIAFLVAGVTLFSLQDVIIKSLSASYPAHEIVFVRSLVAFAPICFIAYLEGGLRLRRSGNPAVFVVRGALVFLSFTFYYLALTALPLPDVVALFYACPLFVTALSVPILREPVGLRRWLAVLAGFAGIVVIIRPGGNTDPAIWLAVAAALSYAISILMTRKYAARAKSATLSFYAMATFIVASGSVGLAIGDGRYGGNGHPSLEFLLRAWVLPVPPDLLLLILCGVIAGIGFYCLTEAYRIGAASVVSPFEYSSLPWALVWGVVFWGYWPGPSTLIGLALIAAAGLYIVRREAVQGRRLVSSRPLR